MDSLWLKCLFFLSSFVIFILFYLFIDNSAVSLTVHLGFCVCLFFKVNNPRFISNFRFQEIDVVFFTVQVNC